MYLHGIYLGPEESVCVPLRCLKSPGKEATYACLRVGLMCVCMLWGPILLWVLAGGVQGPNSKVST